MRALVLVAALSGCGGGGARESPVIVECHPSSSPTCQIQVDLPQFGIVVPWTCTTGFGDDMGRPDHRPCVLCSAGFQMWCETGAGACVHDCAECTPEILWRLNQWSRCAPLDDTPSWYARDMAGGPISGP